MLDCGIDRFHGSGTEKECLQMLHVCDPVLAVDDYVIRVECARMDRHLKKFLERNRGASEQEERLVDAPPARAARWDRRW